MSQRGAHEADLIIQSNTTVVLLVVRAKLLILQYFLKLKHHLTYKITTHQKKLKDMNEYSQCICAEAHQNIQDI